MFSKVTNYIINRFQQDEMVNTISLSAIDLIDTKKENIYPLVAISFNGSVVDEEQSLIIYDYTITVLQQRDNRKVEKHSKLMEDENWIDNLNECESICVNFINYVKRMELDNINIDSVSIELTPLSGYGGANLDGYSFDVGFNIPNTGYCGV
mgnify:CR=1 FL=1